MAQPAPERACDVIVVEAERFVTPPGIARITTAAIAVALRNRLALERVRAASKLIRARFYFDLTFAPHKA